MSHSRATGLKKVKIRRQNVNFAGKRKSLNHFNKLKGIVVVSHFVNLDFNKYYEIAMI